MAMSGDTHGGERNKIDILWKYSRNTIEISLRTKAN
ncbi:hypothetical protein CLW00_11128 [Mongoliibacter ruber]|uniref:Uncharacterized protein n=1 Tax=Mongoliibacter ruber TaxID=1750599 RepID=A0A2T0WG74_9BACT|nr:hypothetical protein CLW00_11128 [Mongoliibacter ruber]